MSTFILAMQPNGSLQKVTLKATVSEVDRDSFTSIIASLGELISAHTTLLNLGLEFHTGDSNAPVIGSANWVQFHKALRVLTSLEWVSLRSPQPIALSSADICGLVLNK
jgi:hypothetical protein